MSTFNKLVSVALLALFATATSQAGMQDKRTKPTRVESMARIVDSSGSGTLRCFQEGRLVFEAKGFAKSGFDMDKPARGSAAVLSNEDGRSVHLIDLRQGMCILDRTDG